MCRLNDDVDVYYSHMLSNLPASSARYEIKAKDAVTGQTKHIDLATLSSKRTELGVVHGVLKDVHIYSLYTYPSVLSEV